jgi:anti-sigma regulatory factor (Ser/Thr protein kinase)
MIIRARGSLNVEHLPSVEPGSELVLDLSEITWTYPSGLVAVACLSREAAAIEVVWPDDADQQRYMSRMHLDELLQEGHPDVQSLPSVRHRQAELCELTFFADFRGVDRLADLIRSHADDARIPADWAWALEEGTWEICANAITHSEWGGGFLAAQHYVQHGEIEYAVGDAGVGIRQSLAEEYPAIADDVAAILKAREYGATRFGQDRRGAGLSETVDQVTRLGGQVTVRSGDGFVTFRRDGHTPRFTDGAWSGTLVKVVLPLPR